MKYVVVFDKNGVTDVMRNVDSRNAKYWLQQSGADNVWIFTTSGEFVCYGARWADDSMSATADIKMEDIHEVLYQAAMIVGETRTPDEVDFNDVLHSFFTKENCGFHHRALRYKHRFPDMPFGVYPYSGKYGEGYIVTHTGGMDYYLKGVKSNEKHFYRFR